ncbi:MAG: imidazolonepropionase [Gemmatimonadota bacterium]
MDPARPGPWGEIRDGAVCVRGDSIVWVGPESELPIGSVGPDTIEVALERGWATPGLIDCHTHLVFGGHRADEFEARLEGASYEELARAGGGIVSTVRATRDADEASLVQRAATRLDGLIDHGCTTVEVKSGYGLDTETELKMLRAARAVGEGSGAHVVTTLLAAHALPPEFADRRGEYVDLVVDEIIPRAVDQRLADGIDAFCESIAFSVSECAAVLRAGRDQGLHARLHADQLTDSGGAALAAAVGATSADHVEYTSAEGVRAMADAGTTAVLLPGAWYVLQETQKPPIEAFRDAGVPMAVATDFNPGSSPVGSPLIAMNMACVCFGLTPAEALAGMTRHAAPVLDVPDRGVLREGARADVACWGVDTPAELSYWIGTSPSTAVIAGGARIR